MRRFEFDPAPTEEHAYCKAFEHEWRKSDILTARAPAHYRIEACKRCGETRRIYTG